MTDPEQTNPYAAVGWQSDDHKDAKQDASHRLNSGIGDAIWHNVARCYLQAREVLAAERSRHEAREATLVVERDGAVTRAKLCLDAKDRAIERLAASEAREAELRGEVERLTGALREAGGRLASADAEVEAAFVNASAHTVASLRQVIVNIRRALAPTVAPEPPSAAAWVDEQLPSMREVARSLGYALAVHGSLARDIDIVAVPWVAAAADPEVLAETLREAIGGTFGTTIFGDVERAGEKPHGRRGWIIQPPGFAGPVVDLSVMSPAEPPSAAAEPPTCTECGAPFPAAIADMEGWGGNAKRALACPQCLSTPEAEPPPDIHIAASPEAVDRVLAEAEPPDVPEPTALDDDGVCPWCWGRGYTEEDYNDDGGAHRTYRVDCPCGDEKPPASPGARHTVTSTAFRRLFRTKEAMGAALRKEAATLRGELEETRRQMWADLALKNEVICAERAARKEAEAQRDHCIESELRATARAEAADDAREEAERRMNEELQSLRQAMAEYQAADDDMATENEMLKAHLSEVEAEVVRLREALRRTEVAAETAVKVWAEVFLSNTGESGRHNAKTVRRWLMDALAYARGEETAAGIVLFERLQAALATPTQTTDPSETTKTPT